MKNTDEPRTPTEAQIEANRRNAQKSTVPRTAEGKAASSRNRLLHGLRANKHILLDEDPAEFLLLVHDHFDRFQPVGPAEEKLVLRIAADQWRLDRNIPMEAGIYRERFRTLAALNEFRQEQYDIRKRCAEEEGKPAPPPPIPPDEGDLLARAFNRDCDGANSFAKLARYEGSAERSIDRCLRQLQKFQAARKASPPDTEPDPPPIPPTPSKSENYHSNPKNGGSEAGASARQLSSTSVRVAPCTKRRVARASARRISTMGRADAVSWAGASACQFSPRRRAPVSPCRRVPASPCRPCPRPAQRACILSL